MIVKHPQICCHRLGLLIRDHLYHYRVFLPCSMKHFGMTIVDWNSVNKTELNVCTHVHYTIHSGNYQYKVSVAARYADRDFFISHQSVGCIKHIKDIDWPQQLWANLDTNLEVSWWPLCDDTDLHQEVSSGAVHLNFEPQLQLQYFPHACFWSRDSWEHFIIKK